MERIRNIGRQIWAWLRRQWRLAWLGALFACAFVLLMWGLPAMVNYTLAGSFDHEKSDLLNIDPLQFLPKPATPTPMVTVTPTPAPTPKLPCIYPADMTYQERQARDKAINDFATYLGVNVDLPGYECTIVSAQRLPLPTATPTTTAAPSPTATESAAPTKSAKATKKTPKHSSTPSSSDEGSATPSATPSPTPLPSERELYWRLEWRPVDYSARAGDLLGEQFQVYSAEIRQSDFKSLALNTEINGNQIQQVTLTLQQRLNESYNLVQRMGFKQIDAWLVNQTTKDKTLVSSRVRVQVSSQNDDGTERISDINVIINEMSGKAVGFYMDESWY